jgi:hypothetical protein
MATTARDGAMLQTDIDDGRLTGLVGIAPI